MFQFSPTKTHKIHIYGSVDSCVQRALRCRDVVDAESESCGVCRVSMMGCIWRSDLRNSNQVPLRIFPPHVFDRISQLQIVQVCTF